MVIFKFVVGFEGGVFVFLVFIMVLGIFCGIVCIIVVLCCMWVFVCDGVIFGFKWWKVVNIKLDVFFNVMMLFMVI